MSRNPTFVGFCFYWQGMIFVTLSSRGLFSLDLNIGQLISCGMLCGSCFVFSFCLCFSRLRCDQITSRILLGTSGK